MNYFQARPDHDLATPFVTLTGIDDRVTHEQIVQLSDTGAELGFLFSVNREGRNRYIDSSRWPAMSQMGLAQRTALHVCGHGGRDKLLLKYYAPFEGLGNPYWSYINELGSLGGQPNLLRHVQRIQVNDRYEPDQIEQICELYPYHVIITQHNHLNTDLLKVRALNHAVVIDASGGTGKLAEQWERLQTCKPVGFAGGLGPDNLAVELPKIKAVASRGWWIDMETKLRVDDWFSMDRALEVMRIFRDNT